MFFNLFPIQQPFFFFFFLSTSTPDGHNDLAWNIKRFSHNRFEFLNLSEGLEQTAPYSNSPWSQTDIPKLKKGQVGAQFW